MNIFVWRGEHVDMMRALRADGLSASQIAAKVNAAFRVHLTRNAVIGKCVRLGIATPNAKGRPVRQTPPKPNGRARKANFAINGSSSFKAREKAMEAIALAGELARELPPDQSDCAVTFAELAGHHCRWPIGAGKAQLYCGAKPRDDDTSYCLRHCRVAFRKYLRAEER